MHLGDDERLLAEIVKMEGTEPAMLQDPELVRMILPALRSDYKAAETYRYRPGPPLRCPVLALTGDADPQVLGQVEEILEWIDELFDLRPERALTESRTADVIEGVLRVRRKLQQRASDDMTAARAASELTDMLRKLGIELVDTPWGTRWRWE